MNFPLVDNLRVKSAVSNMLSSGKMPHAVLIEGDKGLGKTTLARFICRAALCESKEPPCGVCASCRLFEKDNHPDMTVISVEPGKAAIPVSAVRNIISLAAVLPQKSERKVFLIDDAHLMNVQAQNALLKILEEPPASVIFVLTAISRTSMLETVVSRCAVLTLCAPETGAAAEYIAKQTSCDAESAVSALKEARGSIGVALDILNRNSDNSAYITAKEFMNIMQTGSQYDMMKLLLPLEKKRKETLEFYNALEVFIVSALKDCSAPTLIKRYEALYERVLTHKNLLKTNANLSLLLTALSAAAGS